MNAKLSVHLRRALVNQAVNLPRKNIGIALSGGVDSCTLLAACLRASVRPIVLSYTPDTHTSTDFLYAKHNAEKLGLPFIPVHFPMTREGFEGAARRVIRLGYKTKMQVESMAPMTAIAKTASKYGVEVLLTGDQADGYYINGNWISRNYDRARGIPGIERKHVRYDQDAKRIDDLRHIYWTEDRGNCLAVQKLCAKYGVQAVMPYRFHRIRDAFAGKHWREVNEPRLKEPAWQAFPEMGLERTADIWVRPTPMNLHRGDTMFAQVMGQTLMGAMPGPWRTPTGLYSAMARGEV